MTIPASGAEPQPCLHLAWLAIWKREGGATGTASRSDGKDDHDEHAGNPPSHGRDDRAAPERRDRHPASDEQDEEEVDAESLQEEQGIQETDEEGDDNGIIYSYSYSYSAAAAAAAAAAVPAAFLATTQGIDDTPATLGQAPQPSEGDADREYIRADIARKVGLAQGLMDFASSFDSLGRSNSAEQTVDRPSSGNGGKADISGPPKPKDETSGPVGSDSQGVETAGGRRGRHSASSRTSNASKSTTARRMRVVHSQNARLCFLNVEPGYWITASFTNVPLSPTGAPGHSRRDGFGAHSRDSSTTSAVGPSTGSAASPSKSQKRPRQRDSDRSRQRGAQHNPRLPAHHHYADQVYLDHLLGAYLLFRVFHGSLLHLEDTAGSSNDVKALVANYWDTWCRGRLLDPLQEAGPAGGRVPVLIHESSPDDSVPSTPLMAPIPLRPLGIPCAPLLQDDLRTELHPVSIGSSTLQESQHEGAQYPASQRPLETLSGSTIAVHRKFGLVLFPRASSRASSSRRADALASGKSGEALHESHEPSASVDPGPPHLDIPFQHTLAISAYLLALLPEPSDEDTATRGQEGQLDGVSKGMRDGGGENGRADLGPTRSDGTARPQTPSGSWKNAFTGLGSYIGLGSGGVGSAPNLSSAGETKNAVATSSPADDQKKQLAPSSRSTPHSAQARTDIAGLHASSRPQAAASPSTVARSSSVIAPSTSSHTFPSLSIPGVSFPSLRKIPGFSGSNSNDKRLDSTDQRDARTTHQAGPLSLTTDRQADKNHRECPRKSSWNVNLSVPTAASLSGLFAPAPSAPSSQTPSRRGPPLSDEPSLSPININGESKSKSSSEARDAKAAASSPNALENPASPQVRVSSLHAGSATPQEASQSEGEAGQSQMLAPLEVASTETSPAQSDRYAEDTSKTFASETEVHAAHTDPRERVGRDTPTYASRSPPVSDISEVLLDAMTDEMARQQLTGLESSSSHHKIARGALHAHNETTRVSHSSEAGLPTTANGPERGQDTTEPPEASVEILPWLKIYIAPDEASDDGDSTERRASAPSIDAGWTTMLVVKTDEMALAYIQPLSVDRETSEATQEENRKTPTETDLTQAMILHLRRLSTALDVDVPADSSTSDTSIVPIEVTSRQSPSRYWRFSAVDPNDWHQVLDLSSSSATSRTTVYKTEVAASETLDRFDPRRFAAIFLRTHLSTWLVAGNDRPLKKGTKDARPCSTNQWNNVTILPKSIGKEGSLVDADNEMQSL